MKHTLTWIMLPILMLASLPAEAAGPPANRIKQEHGLINEILPDAPAEKTSGQTMQTSPHVAAMAGGEYDGVWSESGRVLLIKQIHNTLYLSGSSDDAAWQAQCVISAALARCLGSGISKTDGEFNYASDLHSADGGLQIDWTRNYSNGHSDSGKAEVQR